MNVYVNWEWDGKGKYTPYCWHKLAQISKPGPSQASVFVDEHEKSITQNAFFTNNRGDPDNPGDDFKIPFAIAMWSWVSFPTLRHNNGCSIGFADGHVESWHFRETRTSQISEMNTWLLTRGLTTANDRDLVKMMDTLPDKVPMY